MLPAVCVHLEQAAAIWSTSVQGVQVGRSDCAACCVCSLRASCCNLVDQCTVRATISLVCLSCIDPSYGLIYD